MMDKCAVGVGVNLFDGRAILLREDGKVVKKVERKKDSVKANETISVVLELCNEIISKAKGYKICGIGLALGGIVDRKKGIVYWPQREELQWVYIGVPLKEYLEDKFKVPIFIENDANSSALAEYLLNFSNYKNLIYMFSGVGCGIIIDGKLYRGERGMAGELFINPYYSTRCSLGDFSFFVQWPADLKVIQRAKELISQGKGSKLLGKVSPTGELSLEDIWKGVEEADEVAMEVVKEAGFSLGIKLAMIVNLLNPEVVVIGGEFEKAGEFFLEEVERAVERFAFNELTKELKIVLSSLGREATSLGAAYLVLKENLQ